MKKYLFYLLTVTAMGAHCTIADDAEIREALDTQLKEFEATSNLDAEIEVEDGIVTLSGIAENLPSKLLATEVAESVYGVRSLINRLEIREIERDDDTIRHDLDRLLSLHYPTEEKAVQHKVNDGVVTLTGTVSTYGVSNLAETMAESILGVRSVTNLLRVESLTPAEDEEIQQHLLLRLKSDPWIDSDLVRFSVQDGVVSMNGAVDSLSERSRLVRTAQVYGVQRVDAENLKVSPELRPEYSRPHKPIFRSDAEIEQALRDALKVDPRIAANNVEISVLDRDITLTGSVNSIGAKAAAEEDAKNVSGAGLVYSYLTVSPSSEVTESALKTALDAIFDSDSLLQGADLTAEVSNGVVEVHGKVLNSFQRRRAIVTAAHAVGVERVINKIRVDWDSGSVAPETAAIQ